MGGALIARMGNQGAGATAEFLSGFFIAGLLWSGVICLTGALGGKMLGEKLLRLSYLASALIFCYFAVYVIYSGYQEFVIS